MIKAWNVSFSLTTVHLAAIYQRAESTIFLPEDLQSDELASLGGLEAVAGTPKSEGRFQVSAPIIILDEATSALDNESEFAIIARNNV